mgnify:CR=1 FL=1
MPSFLRGLRVKVCDTDHLCEMIGFATARLTEPEGGAVAGTAYQTTRMAPR